MSDRKIQWHPGFAAAMHLELNKYKDNLIFEKEYNLNTKPLEIDLLIIKKKLTPLFPMKSEYFSKVIIS